MNFPLRTTRESAIIVPPELNVTTQVSHHPNKFESNTLTVRERVKDTVYAPNVQLFTKSFYIDTKYRKTLISNGLCDIPELYMVNTRAILWFDIVFGFLPSQHDRFRCHSFTIRDVLALKVFVRLNSIFLVFSPAFLSWPARISRRPSTPLGSRKRLSRLQFTHSYQMFQCSLSCVQYHNTKLLYPGVE